MRRKDLNSISIITNAMQTPMRDMSRGDLGDHARVSRHVKRMCTESLTGRRDGANHSHEAPLHEPPLHASFTSRAGARQPAWAVRARAPRPRLCRLAPPPFASSCRSASPYRAGACARPATAARCAEGCPHKATCRGSCSRASPYLPYGAPPAGSDARRTWAPRCTPGAHRALAARGDELFG